MPVMTTLSPSSAATDRLGRLIRDLRISVTDRCNYRCNYCMPYDEYVWIEREAVLSFEEITRLARVFIDLGVEKIRLTGGEPLVRNGLETLIAQLRNLPGLKDLALTTNGSLLAEKAESLKSAGLGRINVSLDTLREDRFRELTQRGELNHVLDGVRVAKEAGLGPIKINAVVMKGFNDDEILDLVDYGRDNGLEMRFIEFLDVGNANTWSLDRTVPKERIVEIIHSRHPLEEVGRGDDRAPSVDYRYLDGSGRVGIIGSLTEPFCARCTRARLTADGLLVTCLFSESGFDLKTPLRAGKGDAEIGETIRSLWAERTDRYSDQRWEAIQSGTYKAGKKIEMITLGG